MGTRAPEYGDCHRRYLLGGCRIVRQSPSIVHMKYTATFKGRDGSLGYRTGQTYRLTIYRSQRGVVISRPDGSGLCPYESLRAFLRNWTPASNAEAGS